MTSRTRTLLASAATVLILALVIVGLWAFTAPRSASVQPVSIKLSPAQQSAQAYQQGLAALSNEQTGTAIADFQKAVSLDPTNADAKTALDKAKSASNSGNSGSGSSTTGGSGTTNVTPAPASVWTTKLDIKKLLPTAFTDYSLGHAEQGDPSDADVSGSPIKPRATVTSIVWTVHDRGSTSNAAAFIADVSKKLYAKNVAQVTVAGTSGYFGTDGLHFATVVYVRGRYVFEVVVTSQQPANELALAQQAAAAFSAAP